jgi:RNAse (barnase) inhibitor barstar
LLKTTKSIGLPETQIQPNTMDRFKDVVAMSDRFYEVINKSPIILMQQAEADPLVYSLQRSPGGGAVRVIRGWKCSDYEALHNEVAAALQFPDYYGENWDAMDECIRDLEWMPAKWYLIFVSTIEEVLPIDESDFGIFLRILSDAGSTWANPEMRGLADIKEAERKPFNVIISGTEEGLLRAKKAAAMSEKSNQESLEEEL